MSSAFDTIHRHKLIEEVETFLEEDDIRMIRLLISNTTIAVRTNEFTSEPFTSNLGSPQGDGLSGTLFNIKFETALRKVRSKVNMQNPEIEHSYCEKIPQPPNELIYADDCDFVRIDKEKTKLINEIVAPTLKEENLLVNEDKTEKTTIKRGDRIQETWRGVKKLGSLLGDSEDITRRKQLTSAAFNKIKSMWLSKKSINVKQKLKIYNALVKSVLLYNACTWGITKAESEKLDSYHRGHLRKIWKRRNMKNKDVYEQSKATPLSEDIKNSRWKMFGHTLRLHHNTPAQQAMTYYFQKETSLNKYHGRSRTTLPITLNNDIKLAKKKYPDEIQTFIKFENSNDLKIARESAKDRKSWKNLCKMICSIA